MSDNAPDQAQGLRRLFGGAGLRSLVFLSASSALGQTALAANVAHLLARHGGSVLLLDASGSSRAAARWFASVSRGDLADVLEGRRVLDEVLLALPGGASLLPCGRWVPGFRPIGWLLPDLAARFDIVLVDVPPDRVHDWWPVAAHASAVAVGSGEDARSLTAGYSLLKRLSGRLGRQQYLGWIGRAASSATAAVAAGRIVRAARRFLDLPVEMAMAVREDPALDLALRQRRPLADAFPACPAAVDFAAFAGRVLSLPGSALPAGAAWAALFDDDGAGHPDPARAPGRREPVYPAVS
ncbi:MAG: MinD/ParA family protein [Pseudomonadota bacterium]